MPESPGAARVIAIANQKGGVGKSTTAVSLGAALADIGYRVLVVDLDPQGNASTGMGIRHEARDVTVYDVVVSEAPLAEAIIATPVARLHAVPSTIDLAGAEIELVSQFSREGRLKRALEPVMDGQYDFVLLDCPPSLGLLTVNALTAARELIVPIQCEYYALEGLGQLLRNVNLVHQNLNPDLHLSGIVMTMFDPRTKLSEQVVEEVQRFFGELVYDVIIPRTVRLSEAPGFGQPITVYDPKSKGAESYRELAREVAMRPVPTGGLPSLDDLPTVVMPAIPDDAPAKEPLEDSALPDTPHVHDLVEEEASQEGGRQEVAGGREEADTESESDLDGAPEPEPPPAPELSPAAGHPTASIVDEEVWDEPEERDQPRVRAPHNLVPPGHLPERRVVVIDDDADLDIEASKEPLVQRPQKGVPADDQEVAEIGATLRDQDGGKRRWRLFRKGGE